MTIFTPQPNNTRKRRFGQLLIALLVATWSGAVLYADSPINRAYIAAHPQALGSIVSTSSSPGVIEAANTGNAANLLGVVVSKNGDFFAEDSSADTPVQTSGVAYVLVSNMNGTIAVNDKIGLTIINGVGAKQTGPGKVIGVAQASFGQSNPDTQKVEITNPDGSRRQVFVGQIPIIVHVADNLPSTNIDDTKIQSSVVRIQALAGSLTGKKVGLWTAVICTIILVLTLIIVGMTLYGGVYGAMKSVGRNPLAKALITKNLLRVIGIAVVTFAVGLVLAYVVLAIF